VGSKWGLERLEKLCKMIIAAKADGRIENSARFICQARVADFMIRVNDPARNYRINTPLLDLMHQAGFNNIGLGVETFSERLLFAPSINKRVSAHACHDVIHALLEREMAPQIYVIIGIPESTGEDLIQTMDAAIAYMDKGCDVGVVPQLRAYPGSPLMSDPDYQISFKSWTHPDSGQTFRIADLFIPTDPAMRIVAENIKQEALKELEAVVHEQGWDDTTIWPKPLIGVTAFLAAARLLERHDVYERYRAFVEKTIAETLKRVPSKTPDPTHDGDAFIKEPMVANM